MKCKSCEGDVPPKFSHAILVNICPLCGNEIMDGALQMALKDLKLAMESVSVYPTEIFDWLKSNYNLFTDAEVQEKVKEAESKTTETVKASFMGTPNKGQPPVNNGPPKKIELDQDGNQIAGPSLQGTEQTNKFFQNALVSKQVDQQAHYKNLVKQIKKSGSPALLDEDGTAGVITPDMAAAISDEDSVELNAGLNAAFGNDDVNSGLDPSDVDYEDEIPAVVMNMAASAGGKMNPRDLQKLQNLQHKSASAKSQIAKTGSVGLIRR